MVLVLGAVLGVAAILAATSSGATGASGDAVPGAASAVESQGPRGLPAEHALAETLPPGHPPIDRAMPAGHPGRGDAVETREHAPAIAVEGKVEEVLPAGRYSYLRFAAGGGDTWAAVEGDRVKVGDRVRITHATSMDGFSSPSLGRVFARIYFGVSEPAPAP